MRSGVGAERRRKQCLTWATASGALCALTGMAVLTGWAFGIRALTSIVPGFVSMKANTALAFVLGGVALGLHGAGRERWARVVARGCAAAMVAIGVLTLFEYATGCTLGIDQLLCRDAARPVGTSHPGRMSPSTAGAFAMSGLALLFLDVETRRGWRPAESLALLTGLLGFVPLTGYFYGEPALTGFFTPFTRMALHTAVAFEVLAAGILCVRPERGMMGLATGNGVGGHLMRTLVPAITLLLILMGWLRLVGEWVGLYTPLQGTALFVALRVAILAIVIYQVARRVQAVEGERNKSEERLRVLNEQLEQRIAERTAAIRRSTEAVRAERDFADTVLETVGALIVVLDREGRIVRFNRSCETTTGYTADEVRGRYFWDLFLVDEEREEVRALFRKLCAGDFPLDHVNHWRTKSGGRRLISWSDTCVTRPDGTVTHIIDTGIDITERRQAEAEVRLLNADLERRVRERTAQLDEANRELEAFSYSVSHDLRAPLRSIDGFSQALLEDYAEAVDGQGKDYLRRVRAATQRMGRLIDDMLVLSRVTRSEMAVAPVDLSALARGIVDELRRAQPEREVDVRIQEGLSADADARLVAIALQNLIGNAWKFTGHTAGARIEFGQDGMDDGVPVYRVSDNGAGFDMLYADRLFVAFQRLHSADQYAGTGVGLAIVQRVIRRHGGRVWARGKVGEGASFHFTLAPAR